jgi:prepilin-type N-terminal cleavage/methylation domain-containing protein
MKSMGRTKRAFTLIELLVVVAIIAVLIAMLMPALSKARRQARLLTCANQLHQVGAALSFYTIENQDKYPPGNSFSFPYLRFGCTTPGDKKFIGNLLLPYVGKRVDMFFCPLPDADSFAYTERLSLFSSSNNNTFFPYGRGGEPGWDVYIGYMYLGNYPQDPTFDKNIDTRTPINSSGERLKVMQDIVSDLTVGWSNYTSHENPNSLYTDGSVISRRIAQLKSDNMERCFGHHIYYWDY